MALPGTPEQRLARARLLNYMTDDSLDGYPIDNNMRFQAQMFSLDYGWVNLWGLGGEYRADDAARLVPVCEEFAQARGVRTRIIELVPSLYRIFEPE
ncbi:hypothetical protein MARCHEWKA_04650 [Brevundimonas phage vB_BpoS-Marchewka]|uniref:Uncharacterized protein n=1 Tax=Brevundimonas phage vB_BpoS-Marchewka TaxID=2948604 RepID=A0A9E7N5T5_9CAUD|nr:hypothetical protein MARCHEWKA_04650 [Brevundimonas phage vB_BpoS-Marchewka]